MLPCSFYFTLLVFIDYFLNASVMAVWVNQFATLAQTETSQNFLIFAPIDRKCT